MAKDLEEALVNIEGKLGGSEKPHMDLGEHLEYIESLIGGGSGGGNVNDVKVNGTSIVEDRVANIQLKTVHGNSVAGEGNIEVPTYSPFKSGWRHDTIAHLMADLNADSDVVVGASYLGEITNVTAAEGLFNGNAEIVVNVMRSHLYWCIISSNNVDPYHWEATFSGATISSKGWTPFVPGTRTIAGIDLKDNITAEELRTALGGGGGTKLYKHQLIGTISGQSYNVYYYSPDGRDATTLTDTWIPIIGAMIGVNSYQTRYCLTIDKYFNAKRIEFYDIKTDTNAYFDFTEDRVTEL